MMSVAINFERAPGLSFEQWFRGEVAADRLYCADEEVARIGWNAAVAAAGKACEKLLSEGEYSGQDVDCYQETADRCAKKVRELTAD